MQLLDIFAPTVTLRFDLETWKFDRCMFVSDSVCGVSAVQVMSRGH